MPRFDCAAYKLLARDLLGCQSVGDAEWRLAGGGDGVPRELRLVWLQGTLEGVSSDRDRASLDDGSGTVQLVGCSSAPGDSQWMEGGEG